MNEDKILKKATSYCAYQERSEKQLREKLIKLGADEYLAEKLTNLLINEKYCDNLRFAKSYVRGKFYQKKWGKLKIKAGLKTHNLPPNLIDIALGEIDTGDYLQQLEKNLKTKAKSVGNHDKKAQRFKVYQSLYRKGFESDLIFKLMGEHLSD
ncbi:MAG: RecX family transcriptional regulator [Saprospirales bacterium]|nr:MAG: RecX family transcriptional regulator [Saprospirales bacterium]